MVKCLVLNTRLPLGSVVVWRCRFCYVEKISPPLSPTRLILRGYVYKLARGITMWDCEKEEALRFIILFSFSFFSFFLFSFFWGEGGGGGIGRSSSILSLSLCHMDGDIS